MGQRQINVTKRDGKKEPYSVEKIQRQIEYACDGITNVSQSMIELSMDLELFDGIKTAQIDQLAINAAVNLINSTEGDANYQYVAGRLQNSVLRKEVYGSFNPPSLYSIVRNNVDLGLYTPDLLDWYSEDEWNLLDSLLDHRRDEKLSWAAIRQFIDKYLVRNRSTGQIVETPQIRYMVAAATNMHAEKKDRVKLINEYYKNLADGDFTGATPVLAGLGTKTKQFSSCVLLRSDDTLDSIFATGEMMAKYAAKRAGIGLEIGRLRPAGSPIRGGEIAHTGLVPFIKKWFGDLRSCSQGGIRNASATLTYPIWHYEFEDLIVLKNNKGTEENRVRHLDYAVMTSAYFWKRFKNKENMSFFDPNEVPDLYESFYRDQDEFIKIYEAAEKNPKFKKRTLNAVDVFRTLLGERTDTGRIYIGFIDNIINQGPVNSKLWPIYQSNLCQEILLPTREFQRLEDENGRIALCTLASENWGRFKKPEDMRQSIHMAVRSLDNILMYQDFLSVQSASANEDFRPLGIGVTNLAYWHAKRGLKYGSPEALAEVARWMEHQYYYALEASIELAKERGPCARWKDTCYGDGMLPIDFIKKELAEVHEIKFTLDWNRLRNELTEHGVRNALLLAIAPVESSSVVIDSTNGIEMPRELISAKDSKAGSLVQVVPEYHRLKDKYQLMYDQTDCIDYLKTAAVMAAITDQSISTNTFYNPEHFPNGKIPPTLIAKNLMLAQRWGIKTIYYSMIKKKGAKASLEEEVIELPSEEIADAYCESCVL